MKTYTQLYKQATLTGDTETPEKIQRKRKTQKPKKGYEALPKEQKKPLISRDGIMAGLGGLSVLAVLAAGHYFSSKYEPKPLSNSNKK